MMEPASEWMVHFIWKFVSIEQMVQARSETAYLDVREVCPDDAVHDSPDVCNRVLVDHVDTQLFSDKTPCTLSAEEVLCANSLLNRSIYMGQLNLNGIRLVLAIVLESLDRPRPLDLGTVLLDILDKGSLDQSLVEQSGKGIPGIDELGATSPCAGPDDTLLGWIPESNLVHLGRLVLHNLSLEAHVSQKIQGTRLDTVCSTSRGRLCSVVDVLDLVAPS